MARRRDAPQATFSVRNGPAAAFRQVDAAEHRESTVTPSASQVAARGGASQEKSNRQDQTHFESKTKFKREVVSKRE